MKIFRSLRLTRNIRAMHGYRCSLVSKDAIYFGKVDAEEALKRATEQIEKLEWSKRSLRDQ